MKELEVGSAVVCEVCTSFGAGMTIHFFELTLASGETVSLSLCKECAERFALAILRAWSPTIQRNMRRNGEKST